MKTYDLVHKLLVEYEPLRSSDKKLLWAVWNRLGLTTNNKITKEDYYKAPSSESVTRARRKVQENHPDLQATPEVQKARAKKETKKGFNVYHEEVTKPHYYLDKNVAVMCNCINKQSHAETLLG